MKTAQDSTINLPLLSKDELAKAKISAPDLVAKAGLFHPGALGGLPPTRDDAQRAQAILDHPKAIPSFPNTPAGVRACKRHAQRREALAARLGLEERF